MADVDGAAISCGVAEIVHLEHDPTSVLRDIAEECLLAAADRGSPSGYAFITWSDVAKVTSPGSKLARHIHRYFPRTVVATQAKRNPNTGNYIKVWVWQIPQERFREHIDEHFPKAKEIAKNVDARGYRF